MIKKRPENGLVICRFLLTGRVWPFMVGVALLAAAAVPAWAGSGAKSLVRVSFIYQLADFSGSLPLEAAPLSVDEKHQEVYVADTVHRSVEIFNQQGMEVYRFGDDQDLGVILGIGVQDDGSILLLSRPLGKRGERRNMELLRCNYRGRLQKRFGLNGLPREDAGFVPNRLVLHAGRIYLADSVRLKVVVTDLQGNFLKDYDLKALIKNPKQAADGMGGFNVDPHGNILFTMPTMFAVIRVTPDGKISSFGQPGSSPGKFGVVGGVAADARGFIYVVDTLRCVVIVFDANYRFQTEFGFRRATPGGLVAPRGIVVTSGNRIVVTQEGGRGVNVYRLRFG